MYPDKAHNFLPQYLKGKSRVLVVSWISHPARWGKNNWYGYRCFAGLAAAWFTICFVFEFNTTPSKWTWKRGVYSFLILDDDWFGTFFLFSVRWLILFFFFCDGGFSIFWYNVDIRFIEIENQRGRIFIEVDFFAINIISRGINDKCIYALSSCFMKSPLFPVRVRKTVFWASMKFYGCCRTGFLFPLSSTFPSCLKEGIT